MTAHYVPSLPGVLAGISLSPCNQPSITSFCVCVGKAPQQCLCHQFCWSPFLPTAWVWGHPRVLCLLHHTTPKAHSQGINNPSHGTSAEQFLQITQSASIQMHLLKIRGRCEGKSTFLSVEKFYCKGVHWYLFFFKIICYSLTYQVKKLLLLFSLPWSCTSEMLSLLLLRPAKSVKAL